ncbi:MAG: hypothetical protein JNL21_40760 [Myxococcales bacterium]|nr:hypothetical protein [Myxococcales bacterium]
MSPESPPPTPDDDLIEDLLDEALAGYEHVLPPEALEAVRARLGDTLAATTEGRRLLRQIKPDPQVSHSADLVAPGTEPSAADEANAKASGGKTG